LNVYSEFQSCGPNFMMTIQNVRMRQDEEAHSELGGKKTWSIVRFMYNIGTPQEPKKKKK